MKNNSSYTKEQREMIEHNETIIQDNIFYGLKNGYSKKEIEEYKKEAQKEMKEFKKFLAEGGAPEFDNETQMYVIPRK